MYARTDSSISLISRGAHVRRWKSCGDFARCGWILLLLLALLHAQEYPVSALSALASSPSSLQDSYKAARQIRCLQGHEAACPLYQDILLNQNPQDGTTATRLAASLATPERLSNLATQQHSILPLRLNGILKQHGYTSQAVHDWLAPGRPSDILCPIHVSPAMAGSSPLRSVGNPKQALIALFLLGLAVPWSSLPDGIRQATTGMVFPCDFSPSLAVSYVSIYPLDIPPLSTTLFFVTDWHPRVLSTIQSGRDEVVMYLGPDSLALVHHWTLGMTPEQQSQSSVCLDLCTGSGIQALVALKLGLCARAVCVDTNPRALQIVRLNAALNGIPEQYFDLVQGDLLTGQGKVIGGDEDESLNELLERLCSNQCSMVTVNPPFLPVPPSIPSQRHGLFSSGGPSGECVLAAALNTAARVLNTNGWLAVVSEFFFSDGSSDALMDRLQHYFSHHQSPSKELLSGLLMTNQYPISAQVYAQRRADSPAEFETWYEHLTVDHKITACSPGLLYAHKTTPGGRTRGWAHSRIPKSSMGSIWTPGNTEAVSETRRLVKEHFGLQP